MHDHHWKSAPATSQRELRNAFGDFLTGVTIVACRDADSRVRAFTANSFASVSLSPPLVLVCIARSAPSAHIFHAAATFTVSILGENQHPISHALARAGAAKDAALKTAFEGDEAVVKNCVSAIFCRQEKCIEAGDHFILLGRVERLRGSTGGKPLGYLRGSYVLPSQVVHA